MGIWLRKTLAYFGRRLENTGRVTEPPSMHTDKPLLLHAHIFKNAGTTIDWILERNFARAFRDDREDQQMRSDPDYLVRLLNKHPMLKSISSHSMPLPVAVIPGYVAFTICFLRHPLLRIRSVYDFEHLQKAQTPGAIHAKKYSFRDYVAWRMEPGVGATIRNMQVSYLTGNCSALRRPVSKNHLERAWDYVAQNPLVGVVEQFDQSLIIIKNEIATAFPNFRISYKKQNVTDKRTASNQEKVELLAEELGADLFQHVNEENRLDLQLYESSRRIVDERFSLIKDGDQRLADLRRECEAA